MKKTVAIMSSRSIKLLEMIIRNEDLNVKLTLKDDAVGDTVIVAAGEKEEVITLWQMYKMVE